MKVSLALIKGMEKGKPKQNENTTQKENKISAYI